MAVTLGENSVIYPDGTVQSTAYTTGTDKGQLISITTYNTSGVSTYTAPTNCRYVWVKLVGGGGGSAGYCESGGAGGYAEKRIPLTAGTQVTVTVGAGGAGVGYYAAGGNGGTSSFGSYVSATGGYGSNSQNNHTGGRGGVGAGGDVNLLGGGSSGWMTAAAICRRLPDIKVTLIESPGIPVIGVGESTIGHINQFLHLLKLKDSDWMPHCNATYKTSIKFVDFRENPTEQPHIFHYPFGIFDQTDKPRGLMDWFLACTTDHSIDPKNFAEFFHDSILMTDAGKMTRNEDFKIRGFNFAADTAYHMDAALFGVYLKDQVCLPTGMTHILDTVVDVELDESGAVKHVATENSGNLQADLYIDCTGFKSLLLEQKLGVEFVSFSDTLLNDSAIATVIPYIDRNRELENYTSCTAIESGWVWNIPLWNRIGTGYVYSSKYATKEQAEEQFRRHLKSNRMICPNAERADSAEFRHIKIKHGVHKHAWEKNVVGIGLANGFIEPLESTGLMLTHEAIVKMIATLEMRKGRVTQFDVDLFNYALYEQVTGFKDFISQHYALSTRSDTAYWQQVSGNTTYSPALRDYQPKLNNSYLTIGSEQHRLRAYNHDLGGIIYILAGMGYNPMNLAHKEFLDEKYRETPGYEKEVYNTWLAHRDQVLKHIETLPTHAEFLAKTIYNNS